MKMHKKHTVWALLALLATLAWVATGASQQTAGSAQGSPLQIEGQITSLSLTTASGPPSMTVKTAEGVEYVVHFGPLRMLQDVGFHPKVGDSVAVSGFACSQAGNQHMVHSNAITLGGKTYSTPMTQQEMMRMGPGMGSGSNMSCGGRMQGGGGMEGGMQGGMHRDMQHHQMHHPELQPFMHRY